VAQPILRTKSLSTKVTEEEYSQLEAQAGGRAISEYAREAAHEYANVVCGPTREARAVLEKRIRTAKV